MEWKEKKGGVDFSHVVKISHEKKGAVLLYFTFHLRMFPDFVASWRQNVI